MKPVVFSLKSDPRQEEVLRLVFSLEMDGDCINVIAGPHGYGEAGEQTILQISPSGVRRITGLPEGWFPNGSTTVTVSRNSLMVHRVIRFLGIGE